MYAVSFINKHWIQNSCHRILLKSIIQMAMYGTPIIYSLDQFAESSSILFTLIKLNPLTTIMDSYRRVFLYHTLPDFAALGAVALFAVILLFIGILVFKKLEKGFAEQF